MFRDTDEIEGKRVRMEMGAPSNMVWARSPYFVGYLSLEMQKKKGKREKERRFEKGLSRKWWHEQELS